MNILGLTQVFGDFLEQRRIKSRNRKIVALRRMGWTYKAIANEVQVHKDQAMEVCYREMGSQETKRYNYQKGELR